MGGVQDPESAAHRQAFERLAAPDTGDLGLVAVGRKGLREAIAVADLLGGLGERGDRKYPGSVLGTNLALAGQLIGAGVGVRVVHLPWGDFDTHEGQRGRHDGLMTDLGASVGAFLADLEARGRGGDVLVATTSEFGRRVKATATGTDHGSASVALLAGPVKAGRHGESPSLRQLDRNDNLVATTNMGEYLATLASWLGLDAADVIEGGPWRPLPGLVFS